MVLVENKDLRRVYQQTFNLFWNQKKYWKIKDYYCFPLILYYHLSCCWTCPCPPSAGVWPPLGSQAGRVRPPLLPVCQAHPHGAADVKLQNVEPGTTNGGTDPGTARLWQRCSQKSWSRQLTLSFVCPPLNVPKSQLMLCLRGGAPGLTNVSTCAFSQKKRRKKSLAITRTARPMFKKKEEKEVTLSWKSDVSRLLKTRQKK